MGLLDKVRSFGSSVVSTSRQAERTAEQAVRNTAHAAADLAKDGFEAARHANPAAASLAAPKALVQHTWSGLHVAAEQFGSALSAAGAQLETGSKKLRLFVPFAQEGVALGAAVKGLGGAIHAAPDRATTLLAEAQSLQQKGEQFLQRAESAAGSRLRSAEAGLSLVKSGVGATRSAVTGFMGEVAKAVDYRQNIDALGPDDTYTLAVGGDLSAEGAKVSGKGQIEIEKNAEGKYVVSVDGELGAGIYGEVGGKVGAQLGAEAGASLGVGGQMEMTFDTAEEAKKATEILLKQAASTALSTNLLVPGLGQLAGKLVAPKPEELSFLADHTSALELSGSVAAEVSACAGLKDVAGLFGSASIEGEISCRIEFKDEKGAPKQPELVVTQSVTAAADLGAGLKLGAEGQGGGSAAFVGGNGEASLEVEQRFTLPDVSGSDLLADPLGTVKQAAASMVKTEQDKITLGLDVSGQALGNGGGVEIEASYRGNFAELQAAVVQKLIDGDVNGALQALDQKDSLEASVKPYATSGISCAPGLSLMGFGLGVELEAIRKDVGDGLEFQGSPSQAAKAIAEAVQPFVQALAA